MELAVDDYLECVPTPPIENRRIVLWPFRAAIGVSPDPIEEGSGPVAIIEFVPSVLSFVVTTTCPAIPHPYSV